ncbi:hypothetical protein [Frankia tisae]|uniref:hypothetical protein n=1 Tax=Frankia tisae TaxID=2950104 RepID=UPI0021BEC9A8|nr:hypothetical protein [Frankia tisae]
MSDELLEHDSDELARAVSPLLGYRGMVVTFGTWLDGVAGTDFVGDAKDEPTLYAKLTFDKIMTAFGKIYGALGQAIGLQGDRLDLVRHIGDQTEDGTTQTAEGWPGGHRS